VITPQEMKNASMFILFMRLAGSYIGTDESDFGCPCVSFSTLREAWVITPPTRLASLVKERAYKGEPLAFEAIVGTAEY